MNYKQCNYYVLYIDNHEQDLNIVSKTYETGATLRI